MNYMSVLPSDISLVVKTKGLGSVCELGDLCRDENARCLEEHCRCMDEFYEDNNNVCSTYICRNK